MDTGELKGPYKTDRQSLEKECIIEFLKASGPGGQHRNKTESGVRIFHVPSGITVYATERRSQFQNLEKAFERLQKRLIQLNKRQKKRIRTTVPEHEKKKRLMEKQRIATIKLQRKKPDLDDYK